MNTSIKINKLSVTLEGKVEALRNINIELPVGKTIGLIGPSGAGKTTLMRAIVGGLKVPNGSILIFDKPAGSTKLRTEVAYMTQELSLYLDLTVRENLVYFATMIGQSSADTKKTVKQVLEAVDLSDKTNVLVENLSGGQKQRVSLAIALIGSPKIMVLDEPTVGLDPVLRDSLWSLFAKLTSQGTTILVSSHSMDEASRCDDLVLLREGQVIAHSSPAEFLKLTNANSVEQGFLKLVKDKKS